MKPTTKLQPNSGKNLSIEIDGKKWARFPVKTHIITDKDDISEVVAKYAKPHMQAGDMLFISERVVATSQGRAFHIDDIKPSLLARVLVKFVYKSPYGIGLGSPWTMELAIREAGRFRIILGTIAAVVTKPFGVKGIFYKVVGHNVNAIDGPAHYVLPPYNKYAKLGPAEPNKVAAKLKSEIGHDVVIIDANDLGVAILGRSDMGLTEAFCKAVFKDNPLGQTTQQTPLCVVRKV